MKGKGGMRASVIWGPPVQLENDDNAGGATVGFS